MYGRTFDLNLKNWNIWGELDKQKSGTHAYFSGIIYIIEWLTQTKFTQLQVNKCTT